MIVDTSALVAVLLGEADPERYEDAIAGATTCPISVANLLEVFIVVESRGGTAAGQECDEDFARTDIEAA